MDHDDDDDGPMNSDRTLSFKRQLRTCSSLLVAPIVLGLMTDYLHFGPSLYYKYYYVDISSSVQRFSVSIAGSILATISLFYIGRRKSVLTTVVVILFSIILYGTRYSDSTDYMSSIIHHLSDNYYLVTHTVYIAEVADSRTRLFFIATYHVSRRLGFIIGTVFSVSEAAIIILGIAFGTLAWTLAIDIPETPYWLALKGQRQECEDVFLYLRDGGGQSDLDELNEILDEAEKMAKNRGKLLRTQFASLEYVIPTVIYLSMMIAEDSACYFMQLIMNHVMKQNHVVVAYMHETFFLNLTLAKLMTHGYPILGSLITMGTSFVFGRRNLFLVPLLLNFSLYSTYFLHKWTMKIPAYMGYFCHLIRHLGAKQVPQLYSVELYPAVLREVGVSTCTIIDQIIEFIITFRILGKSIFQSTDILFQMRWIFIPLGVVMCVFFLPETKGLTMKQTATIGTNLSIYFLNNDETDHEEDN